MRWFVSLLLLLTGAVSAADPQTQTFTDDLGRTVTVPLLTPSIFFLTIMTAIGGFQLFDGLYAMLGPGNPAINQSRSLVYLFYNEAFVQQNKGGGAAIAMFIVLLVGIATAIQFWGQKKWVHYE